LLLCGSKLFYYGNPMKPNRPSTTAEHNAALRAIESLRAYGDRLFTDSYAAFFLSDRLAQVAGSPFFGKQLLSHWEQVSPGVCGAVLVRTRFVDECLEAEIDRGLRQLVVLGAGYDTRALRFQEIKNKVAVFELDHPETQRVKKEIIRRRLGTLPVHVAYIPIRFEEESIAEKLLRTSFDPRAKTFFIWEGVTYYLPENTVDRTLSFIGTHSGEESTVVFDYFPPSVADGTCRLTEAVGLREGLKRFGEEIVSGIAPDSMTSFLQDRGFDCLRNEAASSYLKAFLADGIRKLAVSEIFYFVHAAVASECVEGRFTARGKRPK
jgi:methyltransferase (TIGR00027 family)